MSVVPPITADTSRRAGPSVRRPPDGDRRGTAVTLDGLFSRAAARRPDATAVEDGWCSVTYDGAERRSVQLASALLRYGVQLGDPVIVHASDHVQSLVAQLAVLKAGGVCTPVPSGADRSLIAQTSEVSGARLVLCGAANRADWQLPALVLDDSGVMARLSALRSDRSLPRSGPTDAAYLLVEQDRVGHATGHLIDHKAWLLALADRTRRAGRAERGVLCCQGPGGPSTLTALWWAVSGGGTLHRRQPPGGGGEPAALALPRDGARFDAAVFGPAAYAEVLAGIERRPSTRLRKVVLVGEPCSRELVERHFQLLPHTTLLAEFCPLDSALPWAAAEHVADGGREPHEGRIVGRASPHVRITIRDVDGQAVPAGGTGEIWAAGAALPFDHLGALGAFAAPVRRASFAVSGHLGRWNEDGLLEVRGRHATASAGPVAVRGDRWR
ncbi:AMP-binding protein [Streptomyces sp. NPDC056486]|uniref:AMP-binding protein n=1 Tax=Streptomyces sp. NPDC056486 TaxID=3345835 RepID=UPI00367EE013